MIRKLLEIDLFTDYATSVHHIQVFALARKEFLGNGACGVGMSDQGSEAILLPMTVACHLIGAQSDTR